MKRRSHQLVRRIEIMTAALSILLLLLHALNMLNSSGAWRP